MRKLGVLVSIFVALVMMLGLALPAAASPTCNILVYTGDGAFDDGYTKFGEAAGKEVDTLSVLPSDLSPYCCIILPLNSDDFSNDTISALTNFVIGGGKIVALANNDTYFLDAIENMNSLAEALDADLSLVPASIDPTFHTTTNIDPSPFTAGVSSIRYAWTSEVEVSAGPHAHSLVRTQGGTTFIGADKIGSGWFILSGDSNVFSDNSGNGYTEYDNGVLVRNICGVIEVTIDIKPNSCPNPLNVKSKGVLPVAILGTEDFDVTQIDPSSVALAAFGPGSEPFDPVIPPDEKKTALEDVAAPYKGELVDCLSCWEEGPDGYIDLVLKFDKQEIVAAMGEVEDEDCISLTLTGSLLDGTTFSGSDIVKIIDKGKK